MKISELTHEQCKIIADNRPYWLADNLPYWMVKHRPTWTVKHRPELMSDWKASQDLPADIEALLRESGKT